MNSLFYVARAVVFVVFAALALSSTADQCTLVPLCPDDVPCEQSWQCYPEYYVEQFTEPNWCLYAWGDEVDIKYDTQLRIVSWYVTPANDPGRDGDYVVLNDEYGCRLFQYWW